MGTKTIQMQRDHQKACTIKIWLFDGQQAGEQNSERRLQLVLRQALQKGRQSQTPVCMS
jgi:hypothetical protein